MFYCGLTLRHSDLIFYRFGHLLVKEDGNFVSDTSFCCGKIYMFGFAKSFNSWKKGKSFLFIAYFVLF